MRMMRPERTRGAGAGAAADETLTETMRSALRRDIVSLILPPGQHLTLRDLRERYDTGATPIREALWDLTGEGLVAIELRHGFRVAEASREALTSVMLMRLRVEPLAFARAVAANTPAWRHHLAQAFAALQAVEAKVGDPRKLDWDWEECHRDFHLALVAGCGLPTLMQTVSRWHYHVDRYRRLASPTIGDTAGMSTDHERLFRIACTGDAETAATLMERHIQDTMDRHLSYFDA